MTALWLLGASLVVADAAPVDFDTDIVPILTRHGCNAGACHGAAVGRGGFRLSLYGSNPAIDHEQIAFDLEGRRVNSTRPDSSLLFLKATESINHGGGPRFDIDGEASQILLEWIRSGAARSTLRSLESFELRPASVRGATPGSTTQLRAVARFSDGTEQDVTQWTVFTSNDASSVSVDRSGDQAVRLKVHRRGLHSITARYLNRVLPIEVLVPLTDRVHAEPRASVTGFVDRHIQERLRTMGLKQGSRCDDATFLRRASIRLTGRLPDPAAIRSFIGNGADDRRIRLIDQLIDESSFVEYWTFWLSGLLRIRTQPQDHTATRTYHAWLKDQIAADRPFDELVRELVNGAGDTHLEGPPNFFLTTQNARLQTEFVSEALMGVRLRCANCHDHPLDRWKQDDYHGLAAIFAKVRRGRVVSASSTGEVTHPRTGEAAIRQIPGGRRLTEDVDGRREFGEWLTSSENDWFDRAIVNRLWKAVMGKGLVEPVDDLRDTNPASHPELLEELATDFRKHNRNLRHTLRVICSSDTFQLEPTLSRKGKGRTQFYAAFPATSLSAEVLADAISDVTGVSESYGDEQIGVRAVNLFARNLKSDSLDVLGRCTAAESCDDSDSGQGRLSKSLHLINGKLINKRLEDDDGRLRRLLTKQISNQALVEEFYLRSLCRLPENDEVKFWIKQLAAGESEESRRKIAEDFVWALVTSREFMTCR